MSKPNLKDVLKHPIFTLSPKFPPLRLDKKNKVNFKTALELYNKDKLNVDEMLEISSVAVEAFGRHFPRVLNKCLKKMHFNPNEVPLMSGYHDYVEACIFESNPLLLVYVNEWVDEKFKLEVLQMFARRNTAYNEHFEQQVDFLKTYFPVKEFHLLPSDLKFVGNNEVKKTVFLYNAFSSVNVLLEQVSKIKSHMNFSKYIYQVYEDEIALFNKKKMLTSVESDLANHNTIKLSAKRKI